MKRLSDLWELIPAIVLLVFIVAMAGFVFEIAMAGLRGQPTDPVATTVLGSIIAACIPGLIGLYLRESKPVPPDPPAPPPIPPAPTHIERTGDPEGDAWNEEHGWLQLVGLGGYRWRRS